MLCQHCQAPQPDPPPRFCDSCGMVTGAMPPKVAAKQAAARKELPAEVRCQECGAIAESRRCRGCGARVRWPEGLLPPDERPQKTVGLTAELEEPPAPDAVTFELPDADEPKE